MKDLLEEQKRHKSIDHEAVKDMPFLHAAVSEVPNPNP
jgi:hypothetical protein